MGFPKLLFALLLFGALMKGECRPSDSFTGSQLTNDEFYMKTLVEHLGKLTARADKELEELKVLEQRLQELGINVTEKVSDMVKSKTRPLAQPTNVHRNGSTKLEELPNGSTVPPQEENSSDAVQDIIRLQNKPPSIETSDERTDRGKMNCTAINSNQIETTPNNHPRLMGGMATATPLSATNASRSAKATICVGGANGSSGPTGAGGSIGTTVFFHRTTNNLLDVPRTANSSEEENSPTELNTCRKLTEKPPLVKRLTMGILRTAEDSRPLVHSSSSPSSSSSSSQTISDGYVNEGICADTAETTLSTTVFTTSKISANSNGAPSTSMTPPTTTAATTMMAMGPGAHRSPLSPGTSFAAGHGAILLDAGGPRYNHTATTLLYPPAVPIRNDSLSLKEQHELKGAPWFQAGIPREISLEVLSRQNPGAFLVRQSTTKPGCFALSLRVPPPAPKVAHYLILRTIRGYKIKGFTKEFTSLRALITHHSVMPELLPVPLALPRPPQIVHRQEDPETYGSLNDFQNMITE